MRSPGFLTCVGVALALSLAGSAAFAVLTQLTDTERALEIVVTMVSAAYLGFLLWGSTARVGKVSTVMAFGVASGLCFFLRPDFPIYLLLHIGLLWLVRSVYFYRSVLAAALDAGLQCLSFAAAFWALQQTGSLLLCLWSFFLVQALFVVIPATGFRSVPPVLDCVAQANRFQKSHRSAQRALRRLY